MIKIQEILPILPSVLCSDFKFFNQRTVCLILTGDTYYLSKDDVVNAIKYYINRIHKFSDKPVRCEGMNFAAFKMFDLVPYLYTLLNLYLSVYNNPGSGYDCSLPELKLTRFCHLPFGEEIEFPQKQDLVVMCSLLSDALTGKLYYVCYVNHSSYCSESVETLLSDIRSCDPSLFRSYNVILKVIGSHGSK